jgi:hypothetical protein
MRRRAASEVTASIRCGSDLSTKQRIDILVSDGFGRTIEDRVAQTAHPRAQLDAEQSAETEDPFALTLGVGVEVSGWIAERFFISPSRM